MDSSARDTAPADAERAARCGDDLDEELRLAVRNDLSDLARVNDLATALLERRGAAAEQVYATQLALEELLSNVIRHGYPPDGERHEIEVALRVGARGVELVIVDDGREFDLTRAPNVAIDVPLAQRRVGGLGIHLVHAFVREIRYERHGGRNHLRLHI